MAMSLLEAVPYTALSGVQVLPGAVLAAMTPAGSSGLSPVRLDGADSTAGAPGGGAGVVAWAGLAKPTSRAPASAPTQAAFRFRRHTRLTAPPHPQVHWTPYPERIPSNPRLLIERFAA